MDNYNNGYTPDPNQYQNPEQPAQPDYASQYNQDQNAGYDAQYNQYNQQGQDYANQYNQGQDYANQYNQPAQQYDYNQYNQQAYNPTYDNQGEVLTGAPKVFSIISLVCGIIAMVFGVLPCTYYLGPVFGIPALIFAIIAKKKYTGKNVMATLGLIFGIVGMAVCVIYIGICICTLAVSGSSSYYSYY